MPEKTYTQEEMRKAVIAYLAFGNSVEDLVDQYIELVGKSYTNNLTTEESYKTFFEEIVDDAKQEIAEDPGNHESTVEEAIQMLLETYNDHEYEANSPIWG